MKVAINGFGRIGRMVLRSMTDDELKKVVAINDLTDNKTLAHLLKYDSSQGQFAREVSYDDDHIIVDGHKIHATAERDPANLPWGEWNADVILESTGFFCSREGASKHISAGAKKVLISAPASDPDLTMCLGINDSEYDAANHHIVSNASCNVAIIVILDVSTRLAGIFAKSISALCNLFPYEIKKSVKPSTVERDDINAI